MGDTDKNHHVTLSNDNRTAFREGLVRAGKWVPREGHASATVRVDCLSDINCYQGFEIGVIGVVKGYDWLTGDLYGNHPYWSYDSWGDIYGEGCCLVKRNDDTPKMTEGSEVTVTLTGGIVTFTHDGTVVHTLELPENCGL